MQEGFAVTAMPSCRASPHCGPTPSALQAGCLARASMQERSRQASSLLTATKWDEMGYSTMVDLLDPGIPGVSVPAAVLYHTVLYEFFANLEPGTRIFAKLEPFCRVGTFLLSESTRSMHPCPPDQRSQEPARLELARAQNVPNNTHPC